MEEHEAWFRAYALRLRAQAHDAPGHMTLKLEHTFAVLARARRIASAEGLPEHLLRAAELAALYHDVARFEQYLRWHTFRDSVSVNHGLLGAQLLKRLRRLEGEEKNTRVLVRAAVALHNRYALPASLPDEARLVTGIVRDADKLDILRVMEQHLSGTERDATVVLHVADEPDRFSPEVVEAALTGRLASYGQLRYVNDFRILLGTWIHDLSFASSRRMMAEEGYIRRILDGLPDLPPLRRARHALLEKIEADGASGQPARRQVSG